MKYNRYILGIIAGLGLLATGCSMDLTPTSQGNSASWYSTEAECQLAVNEFYMMGYWNRPLEDSEQWTDNITYRQVNRNPNSGGALLDGNTTGSQYEVYALWQQSYKLITRANGLLENIHRAENNGVSADKIKRFKAEAYFARACKYADLLFFYGDLPYVEKSMTIEEACKMGRRPKDELIPLVYADFDMAIEGLPVSWEGANVHATKGAAYAMKARFALYMGDWAVAAEAAKKCMDLKVYELHSDYNSVFYQSTGLIPEKIFVIPRSIENKVLLDEWYVKNGLPRNAGGYGSYNPSWDLLAAYTCTDGLPIDESPLFNPQAPFANRDPRCTATIVEFGTAHVGYIYDPSPAALKVLNLSTGKEQDNQDSRAVNQYASYNGLVWKKGVDQSWLTNFPEVGGDYIIMRYADVLLMYAEAKIELNEIDATVLNAINTVRGRAYGFSAKDFAAHDAAVTTTDQTELRRIIRNERRVELAKESLRLQDLMRWKLAGKALNTYNYIYLYPAEDCKTQLVDKGLWPWPATPAIDEDGIADFSPWVTAGQVMYGAKRNFPEHQYLWPIPTYERELCPELEQNTGY